MRMSSERTRIQIRPAHQSGDWVASTTRPLSGLDSSVGVRELAESQKRRRGFTENGSEKITLTPCGT